MEEPEGEPGAQPGTLAPQCENTETADYINRDTDAPLSLNSTNEVAVSETDLEDKETVSLPGELSSIANFTLGEEKEEVGAMAGDVNPSVKKEKADAGEAATAEVESVQCLHPVETAALHEAVISDTEEVLKEEGSQIDHAVKKEGDDDDQMEISMKGEVGPAVNTGLVSEAGAVREVMIAGNDDTMPKEEVELEQEVELIDETERKEDDVIRTDEEAPHLDQKMVQSETNFEVTDELRPEDSNPTQEEEKSNMDALMHDDHGGDKAMDEDLTLEGDGDKATDEDLTQDGDGDKATDEDLTQDGDGDKATDEGLTQEGDGDKATDEDLTQGGDGDKAMDEDLTQDGDGDKVMDEDLTQDGDGDKAMDEDLIHDGDEDKAMNELSTGVDGGGLDDDTDDDQAKHGEEVMGTNDGEEDEEEDDPPPLPAKKSSGGRKKRGRAPRIKKGEEELCFICFDGGELVVCDRRGCPKVYHPSCVNRDEAFFRAKGKWNCGWHICSECQKPARLMCYTCTYSLCKGCMKGAEFLSVRGNMGFCPSCLSIVTMIEKYERGEQDALTENINFEDKSSWEFLFRDYWLETKGKQSLTLEEILAAKSQQNTPVTPAAKEKETSDEHVSSDNSSARRTEAEETLSKRISRKRLKQPKATPSPSSTNKRLKKMRKDKIGLAECSEKRTRTSNNKSSGTNWASEELLDFVAHMRDGDRSVISQFDVQALLLEYIKRKNLRDPRRKSQIICDRMLENLFGKPRVGHFEMLKLLESHFFEVPPTVMDDNQGGGVVDPEPDPEPENSEGSALGMGSEKRRKGRGKGARAMQGNLDDYAAIDMHNIGLIYLRRNLMEEIVDSEPEDFEEKVVGSFVRIRISSSGQQRQDIYRLVQVVGTGRATEKYKMGKRMTDITLEILNLDKQEFITIDIISNQEFTEEECKRLRQSIKYNFIPRLTVGEIQDKARVLQTVKVNDWIESEKMRLSHLRDRASETGRRKELRECVEKLQLLNTPEERLRRLRELPEIHADPTMDPDYESAEEVEPEIVKKDQFTRRDSFGRRGSEAVSPHRGGDSFGRRGEAVSPHRGGSGFSGDNWRGGDSWKGSRRNQNEAFINSLPSPTTPTANRSAHPWSSEREREREREKERERERERERQRERERERERERNLHLSSSHTRSQTKASTVDESEKIWQYLDPAGKTQGPFSLVQLRKWNSSGYFPSTLKVWRLNEKQEDSILLTDALNRRFQKEERNTASPYTIGQRRGGGEENPPKSEKPAGGNELKTNSVVNYGAVNSVSVSPAFVKAESSHALDRSASFSAEGTSRLPGDASQVSHPPTEHSLNQSNIQQKSDPSITVLSDPNSTSNTVPASVGPAQQMTNSADWATAAAAMAQQMAAMGTNGAMAWNPQIPVQGSANTSWGNMVGPTGMNMGWSAPNFNIPNQFPGNPNMNFAWGPQAMQPATAASWGTLMPGSANPVNQFPAWGVQTPNVSNWGVGPAQGPNATQNQILGAGPVQGNGNASVAPVGGDNSGLDAWPQGGLRSGVCKFYENGHCRKGSGCNYYHPPEERR